MDIENKNRDVFRLGTGTPSARSDGRTESVMALNKPKAVPEKSDERGKKPDWAVRARQGPGSDFFVNCGAAWNIEVNGKDAISLKLTAIPVQSDGSFLLLPPKED